MASKHYVNNGEMLLSIKAYKEQLKTARESNLPDPRVPEYLGECVLKIATGLSRKINFVNYSYKDDMILDGIENAIYVINSFDPEKSSNPFSYFTQVIYFAFLRRIAKEKKHAYIRGRLIQDMSFDSYTIQAQDDDIDFKNAYMSFIQTHSTFDDSFMNKKLVDIITDKVVSKKSLELFMGDDETDIPVFRDITPISEIVNLLTEDSI